MTAHHKSNERVVDRNAIRMSMRFELSFDVVDPVATAGSCAFNTI